MDAVLAALRNKNVSILDYLLFRNCPQDALLVNSVLGRARDCPHRWEENRDIFKVAVKYRLPKRDYVSDLMRVAEEVGDVAFIETARSQGYSIVDQED